MDFESFRDFLRGGIPSSGLMTLTDAEESLSLQENASKNYIDYFVKTFFYYKQILQCLIQMLQVLMLGFEFC